VESATNATGSYSLVITRRDASEILLLPNARGWTLPQVEIDPGRRLAEQLNACAREFWKVETYCLLVPIQPASATFHPKSAVLESVNHNGKSPVGAYWMPRWAASRCSESPAATAITDALQQLDAYAAGQLRGHFVSPGWLRELFRWSQEIVASRNLRLTGSFRQLNASPKFSLIRLAGHNGAAWFKATGEPNSHELPVTLALSRLFPRYLPQMLGVHREWNGWLSQEVEGASLAEAHGFEPWERVARDLAELQISSIGKIPDLLAAGLRDLRIQKLLERIDPFISRMNDLMEAQTKLVPSPLSTSELAALANALKESLCRLCDLGLPTTLGHLDFNPGNVLLSKDGCVFLDWSEACVTTPLITFEYLRQHMKRRGVVEKGTNQQVTAAYVRHWARACSSAKLMQALMIVPLAAVFLYALAANSWSSVDPKSDSKLASYYRSLTRRMYHEANQLTRGNP
jgi:Ser/Thr protein kinase RdoA (MazF antagonist)